MPQRRPAPRPKQSRWYISFLKWGLVAGLALFIALAVAVALAYRDLPSFDDMKRSPNGQPVEIRGDDGTVLASFGPSYGAWLSYPEIPATMKNAMIAVEDRRFWYHPGIDPFLHPDFNVA